MAAIARIGVYYKYYILYKYFINMYIYTNRMQTAIFRW